MLFLLYYAPLMTIINVIFGIRFTDVKPFLKTSVTVDDMTKTLLGLILEEVFTNHTYFQYTDGNIKYDNTGGGGGVIIFILVGNH